MTGEDHARQIDPPAGILAALFVVPLVADLVAKFAARRLLSAGEPVAVFPGFDLTLSFNPGVSFALFPANEPMGVAFMIAVQLAITTVLIVWALRQREFWLSISVALIASGAAGNILDRLFLGAVTDFIDLHAGTWHWPAFNLADCAIFLGVAALVVPHVLPNAGNILRRRRTAP